MSMTHDGMNAEACVTRGHVAAPLAARREKEPSGLRRLVHRVRDELQRRYAGTRCDIFETHISIVLLAGDFAYKFKKPVNFGFLDFSTLERRRHFCKREVALNHRTAPGLYCGVVPVIHVLAIRVRV